MRRGMKDPGVKRKYSPHKTTVIPYTPRKCLCQFSAVSAAPAGITGLLCRVLTRPTHPTNRRQGGGSPGSHLMAVISAMPQKRPVRSHLISVLAVNGTISHSSVRGRSLQMAHAGLSNAWAHRESASRHAHLVAPSYYPFGGL